MRNEKRVNKNVAQQLRNVLSRGSVKDYLEWLTYITRMLPKIAIMAIHIVRVRKINLWTSVNGWTSNSHNKINFLSTPPPPSFKSKFRADVDVELFPGGISIKRAPLTSENVLKWNELDISFSLFPFEVSLNSRICHYDTKSKLWMNNVI